MSHSTSNRLFVNTFLAVVSKNLINILVFFSGIFLIRLLPTDDYGRYSYVSSVAGIFGVVINFGLNNYFLREMSREKDRSADHLANFLGLQTLLALITFAVILGMAFFHHDGAISQGLALFGLSTFLASLFCPLMCILASRLRNDLVYYEMLLQAFLQLALTAVGFWASLPLTYYFAIPLITAAIRLLHSAIDSWRNGLIRRPSFKFKTWGKIFHGSLPFAVLTIVNVVYMKQDVVLFSNLKTYHWTAVYSVASRFAYILIILPAAFTENLYPVFSERKHEDHSRYRLLLEKYTYYNFALCLPLAVGGCLEAQGLIRLFFGERYLEATMPFCLYLFIPVLVSLYIACNHYLIAFGKTWNLVWVAIAGLVVNLAANLVVLTTFDGIAAMTGATLVTLSTEALLCGFSFYFIRRMDRFEFPLRRFVRVLPALACMAGVLWVVPLATTMLRVAIGAMVYGLGIWFFGAILPDDRARILGYLRRAPALDPLEPV